jgi:hypothetical protein
MWGGVEGGTSRVAGVSKRAVTCDRGVRGKERSRQGVPGADLYQQVAQAHEASHTALSTSTRDIRSRHLLSISAFDDRASRPLTKSALNNHIEYPPSTSTTHPQI